LGESGTWKKLQALEQKLQNQEQSIFNIIEYIATSGRQTDFLSMKQNCFQLLEKLNNMAIEAA